MFNLFNFANFNLPPGAMTGWLNEGAGSINSVQTTIQPGQTGPQSNTFRVGNGTGVFALGAPRVIEWGLKLTFYPDLAPLPQPPSADGGGWILIMAGPLRCCLARV